MEKIRNERGILNKDIKRRALYYVRKFDTTDPFKIADYLNIKVFCVPLGKLAGYYKYLKRHRCIYINSDIEDDNFRRIVMAHELGHAVLHRKENCYFIKNKTLLLSSKVEIEANKFAAELLIPDSFLLEYEGYTSAQIAADLCVDEYLLNLKLTE